MPLPKKTVVDNIVSYWVANTIKIGFYNKYLKGNSIRHEFLELQRTVSALKG